MLYIIINLATHNYVFRTHECINDNQWFKSLTIKLIAH